MKEVEKENGETFIEEVTLRLCFPKKWLSMTKGDIQKILNKYIEEDEWQKQVGDPKNEGRGDKKDGVEENI